MVVKIGWALGYDSSQALSDEIDLFYLEVYEAEEPAHDHKALQQTILLV